MIQRKVEPLADSRPGVMTQKTQVTHPSVLPRGHIFLLCWYEVNKVPTEFAVILHVECVLQSSYRNRNKEQTFKC